MDFGFLGSHTALGKTEMPSIDGAKAFSRDLGKAGASEKRFESYLKRAADAAPFPKNDAAVTDRVAESPVKEKPKAPSRKEKTEYAPAEKKQKQTDVTAANKNDENVRAIKETTRAVDETIASLEEKGADAETIASLKEIASALKEIIALLEALSESEGAAAGNGVQSIAVQMQLPSLIDALKNALASDDKDAVTNVKHKITSALSSLNEKHDAMQMGIHAEKGAMHDEHAGAARARVDHAAAEAGTRVMHENAAEDGENVMRFEVIHAKSQTAEKRESAETSLFTHQGIKQYNAESMNMGRTTSITRFQSILPKLVEHARMMVQEGKSEMTLALKPDHLGKVTMKLTMEGDTFTGKIIVDNPEVKAMFERNMHQLVQGLSEMNVAVGSFDVALRQEQRGNENDENDFALGSASAVDAAGEADAEMEVETYYLRDKRLSLVI